MDFSKIEKKTLKLWKTKKVFEKSLKKNKNKKKFVFFEGPPTANGRPGMHHVEARAFKDIIPRYKTMRGFCVDRKAGWDTHGLPVEIQVEKELGFKSKDDIEKYGIDKFNKKCQQSVWRYKDEWEKLTERVGYWIDMTDPYITYKNSYIESIWHILKQVWDKGLLYKGFKIIHHCPRCGTGLSSHEVAQGYQKVKERSVYLNFKVTEAAGKAGKNDIILAWTTTPWTLPGNVALAVGEKIDYVKISHQDKKYILAKNRLDIVDGDFEVLDKFKGKDLVGAEYAPLFDVKSISKTGKKSHYVALADFVSTDEGTGVVHTAVMYGEDDYLLGEKLDLPRVHTVNEKGYFTGDLKDYNLAGKFVKDKGTERVLVDYLEDNGLLFKQEQYEHDYPFCWRCDTPLLYYAKDSWFIKMSELRKELKKNNAQIHWEPDYIKDGRFGEFIREAKDWALSRERYWGTPLNIWQCQKCGGYKAIGSAKELGKELKDLHRPYIDKIKLDCKCGGKMVREKSVLDVWFDSGAMPFAQWGYPQKYGSKKKFQNHYPADFICEAIDQTRGWFYTLLAIATLMEKTGEVKTGVCYKNVISLGHVLDANGKKMSKSRGNVVDPWEVCEKFGADTLRWYLYTVNQAGDPKKFDVKDVADKNRRVFGTLYNSFLFFETYKEKKFIPKRFVSKSLLDRWIVSRFNSLNEKVIDCLENYDVVLAARQIEDFVEDFSNWYIRRSRERIQRTGELKQKQEALQTMRQILFELSKVMAPFAPFLSEEIFQNLKTKTDVDSVHLASYPKPQIKLIDKKLEDKMLKAREVVALALGERSQNGIKVRQPLKSLKLKTAGLIQDSELLELIKAEVNVKEVVHKRGLKKEVELDTEITFELKKEGLIRELIRSIQQMRKDAGFKPGQPVYLRYQSEEFLSDLISDNLENIKQETSLKKMELALKRKEVFLVEKEIALDGQKIWLAIRK